MYSTALNVLMRNERRVIFNYYAIISAKIDPSMNDHNILRAIYVVFGNNAVCVLEENQGSWSIK